MGPRLLAIETSGRGGWAALAEGEQILGTISLDPNRRHAQDLAPGLASLLASAGWKPAEIALVAVGQGPGGYTGLRVGLMTARAWAYASGCRILGINSFAAIAAQTPNEAAAVEVIADAQQNKLYVQSYVRQDSGWHAQSPATVRRKGEWLAERPTETWLTGPAVGSHGPWPESTPVTEANAWQPRPETIIGLALSRWHQGEADDVWNLEPLYLRVSSAEEQWKTASAAQIRGHR